MYAEKGQVVQTWNAADYATDIGGIREWKMGYTFKSAGNRKLTFDAADKNGNKTKAVECPLTVE